MVRKSTTRPSMLSLKIVYNLFVNKKGITINELARNLKIDYKNVYDCVDFLFKEGMIKKEKIGNYNICNLNYFNEGVIEYLKEYNFYFGLKEFKKKYSIEYGIIVEACQRFINQEMMTPFFICLVFGSYAKGEEKKNSDVDLLFLGPEKIEMFKSVLNKTNAPYQKKFHLVEQGVFDFIMDLGNKDKVSLATELYKNPPIIFYGDDIFFRIMIEDNKQW